jgi:hypothetical protein
VIELEGVSAHIVSLSSLIEDKSEPHGRRFVYGDEGPG